MLCHWKLYNYNIIQLSYYPNVPGYQLSNLEVVFIFTKGMSYCISHLELDGQRKFIGPCINSPSASLWRRWTWGQGWWEKTSEHRQCPALGSQSKKAQNKSMLPQLPPEFVAMGRWIFIGPRYTWGPIYGSKSLSVRNKLMFGWLNWCDSGWWIYQLNSSWWYQ